MARHAPLLFTVLAVLAVAAAAYVRAATAADKGDELLTTGHHRLLVGDETDEFGLGGVTISRRRMQDVNDSSLDANETSTADDSRYISYGALSADSTPCALRGASYYNCRPGGEANPYTRGCSTITQCRS